MVDKVNFEVYKRINDYLFTKKTTLTNVINSYHNTRGKNKDEAGKYLYKCIITTLEKEYGMSQSDFLTYIAKVIRKNVDFTSFAEFLQEMLLDKRKMR